MSFIWPYHSLKIDSFFRDRVVCLPSLHFPSSPLLMRITHFRLNWIWLLSFHINWSIKIPRSPHRKNHHNNNEIFPFSSYMGICCLLCAVTPSPSWETLFFSFYAGSVWKGCRSHMEKNKQDHFTAGILVLWNICCHLACNKYLACLPSNSPCLLRILNRGNRTGTKGVEKQDGTLLWSVRNRNTKEEM